MSDDATSAELLAELRAIRHRLGDLARRHLSDAGPFPPPTGRREGGVEGPCWSADRGLWKVTCPDDAEDRGECVYVDLPHRMSGDVEAISYEGACELAEALLAAVERGRLQDEGVSIAEKL